MESNKQKLLKKVARLYALWQSKKIKRLTQHETHPHLQKGSRENYLYFTLPAAINFQRNSPAMWQSAYKTWNDQKTKYVFFPERIAKGRRTKIQKDLLKHRLATQTNTHPHI